MQTGTLWSGVKIVCKKDDFCQSEVISILREWSYRSGNAVLSIELEVPRNRGTISVPWKTLEDILNAYTRNNDRTGRLCVHLQQDYLRDLSRWLNGQCRSLKALEVKFMGCNISIGDIVVELGQCFGSLTELYLGADGKEAVDRNIGPFPDCNILRKLTIDAHIPTQTMSIFLSSFSCVEIRLEARFSIYWPFQHPRFHVPTQLKVTLKLVHSLTFLVGSTWSIGTFPGHVLLPSLSKLIIEDYRLGFVEYHYLSSMTTRCSASWMTVIRR